MDSESFQQAFFELNNATSDSNYYTSQDFTSRFKNTSKTFSLLHVNSRSLNKNFESLQTFLHTLDHFPFSVIGVTETWLHTLSPELFNMPNYEMIRHDRVGKRGGGIAFYIQENLKFKIRHNLSITESESLFIEIENLKEKNIIIGFVNVNSLFVSFYYV